MSVTEKLFGTINGVPTLEYCLKNKNGMEVDILEWGAIITKIIVPDKNGNMVDVVLGHHKSETYAENPGYFGATVGRCANRLEEGLIRINGREYRSGINDGRNSLHGGIRGLDKRVWEAHPGGSKDEPEITFLYVSPDGEEGYPGRVHIEVKFSLFNDNTLSINYFAMTNKATVLNMTNHSYFNLGGYDSGTIDDHEIELESSFFTPNNAECMPTGEILSVEGRPFDMRMGKKFGEIFASNDEQIKMFGGLDHNFVIDGEGMRKCGSVYCHETGIIMDCFTDMPGVQIYTANMIDKGTKGKDGKSIKKHAAVCMETQYFPNAMKYLHFPSPILKPGRKYNKTTMYRFSARDF